MSVFYNRTVELMVKHLSRIISSEETKELEEILDNSPGKRKTFEELTNGEWLALKLKERAETNFEDQWEKIDEALSLKKPKQALLLYTLGAAVILVAIII